MPVRTMILPDISANDRSSYSKGMDWTEGSRRKADRRSFRAHQVPIMMDQPEHLQMLNDWLKSYHPEELFDENGKLIPELKELAPKGDRRIGSNPHANGGKLLRDLRLPDFRKYGIDVPKRVLLRHRI